MTTSRKTTAAAVKKTSKPTASKTKAATQTVEETKAPAAKKATVPKPAQAGKAPRKAAKAAAADAGPAMAPADVQSRPQIPELSPEQRRMYVEVAAYYIAERRGFHGGSELEDWLQAEAEIDRLLREGILKP